MARLYPRNRDLSEPLETVELVVEDAEQGRLDAFLAARLSWRSRSGARKLIEQGAVQLNGGIRKPSARVKQGDRVVVDVRRPAPQQGPGPPQIRVLFEDEFLMALDKPSGVVVHPVGTHQHNTLLQELHKQRGDPLPKLIHRIDQFTSGVLLVAKIDPVRAAFSDMLERGEVFKAYDALLLGRPQWDQREIDEPIGVVGESRILMKVDRERGKPARSVFSVKERFRFAAHVTVRIHTGRTHQIRVHAGHLGHPLLGDHLYGDGIAVGNHERFALHARSVAFTHPETQEELRIEAPLPDAFVDAMALLRRA